MGATAAEVAADREKATHGCCCRCCTLRMEIWACFFIDLSSILGLLVEIPGWAPVPASLHAVDMYNGYLIFSIFSACIILFALYKGQQEAWPRRLLVRLMTIKLPFFLIFCMGYFTISPWAVPLAEWVCEHDFQQMRTATGGDYATCVRWFPWLCTLNNAIYIFAYAYTIKASHEWFRCHPDNDSEGVWCARAVAAARDGEYANLEQGRPTSSGAAEVL